MKKKYLEAGKIVSVHALKGELKVQPYCDSAEFLLRFDKLYLDESGTEPLHVIQSREHKGMLIVQFEGIATPEQAYTYRGRMLYFDRADADLDEGDYFICDLIGLPVMDADNGREYGMIADVTNRGASDIYVINTQNGEVMIPAVDEYVVNIDTEKGIFIRPIAGMFSEADTDEI